MATYTCEICYEEKKLGEMTLCGNGHFGGCQKCHMSYIKEQYKDNLEVFVSSNSYSATGVAAAQRCMFCREDMADIQMGENWAKKLYTLQPIMMFNSSGYTGEMNLAQVIKKYDDVVSTPELFSYKWLEDMKLKHTSLTTKVVCKLMGIAKKLELTPKCWKEWGEKEGLTSQEMVTKTVITNFLEEHAARTSLPY